VCSPDARAINDNLVEAMRFFGRARENGHTTELSGASVVYCGLDYAAFNAAVMCHPVRGRAEDLDLRILDPAIYFETRRLRWSYWFCDDYVGKRLLPRARSMLEKHGLRELTEAPGMMVSHLPAQTRPLPPLDVRTVSDAATRAAFAHITSVSFDVPWTVCREVYGAERAWTGSFRGYVGYSNGLAVCTIAIVVAADVAGVYSVGTLPGHRGRGYAEAIMRVVLDSIRAETGVQRSALQATRSGYSLYVRMGYKPVTRFSVFITY
jgi:GNAT superfamily N-acetyltransferase